VKRRAGQEREEADAREQAEVRREALLAELRAREAAGRTPASLTDADAAAAGPDGEPHPGEVAAVEGREPAADEPAESA
jgi:hypothetical protein